MLVSGCSHTEGVGIDAKYSWASLVSRQLDLDLINLSRRGACAQYVAQVLMDWLSRTQIEPKLVIVQWPNPYRDIRMFDGYPQFVGANYSDPEFEQRLRHDPNSFIAQWRETVVDFNSKCQLPVINMCLESQDSDIGQTVLDLRDQGIVIHVDEKIPGRTWHFDSAGSDRIHHSEKCHQKWADRILTIVENVV
jgi:hypothetical protein